MTEPYSSMGEKIGTNLRAEWASSEYLNIDVDLSEPQDLKRIINALDKSRDPFHRYLAGYAHLDLAYDLGPYNWQASLNQLALATHNWEYVATYQPNRYDLLEFQEIRARDSFSPETMAVRSEIALAHSAIYGLDILGLDVTPEAVEKTGDRLLIAALDALSIRKRAIDTDDSQLLKDMNGMLNEASVLIALNRMQQRYPNSMYMSLPASAYQDFAHGRFSQGSSWDVSVFTDRLQAPTKIQVKGREDDPAYEARLDYADDIHVIFAGTTLNTWGPANYLRLIAKERSSATARAKSAKVLNRMERILAKELGLELENYT